MNIKVKNVIIFTIVSIIFVFLSFSCSIARDIDEPIYIYRDMETDLVMMLFKSRDGYGVGDVTYKSTPCDVGDINVCIMFGKSIFTLPEKGEKNIRKYGYNIIFSDFEERNILGNKYNIINVFSSKDDYETRFIYSKEAGLLMIFFTDNKSNKSRLYLLQGKCGYKPMVTCE